jgi:hypothetical protein
MESFIQLNLRSDSEKAAADNLPNNPQNRNPEEPVLGSKRLNKMLRKAAHKASAQYGRSNSGVISK